MIVSSGLRCLFAIHELTDRLLPFLSCLPCFKDKETRHSTEDELKKPIPVERIVNNSNGSAAKPSTNVTSTSNAVTFISNKQQESINQSTSTDAVAYPSDNQQQSNDRSASTQAVTYANQKPDSVDPADSNGAITLSNDRRPEPNAGPSLESNVPALTNRELTATDEAPTGHNSIYATPAATMADSLKSGLSGVTDTVSSGAQQAQSAASSGAQQVQSTASTGAEKVPGAEKVSGAASSTTSGKQDWHAMTEDQKKQTYDALPEGSDQKKMGYYEWVKQGLYNKKENWMPWIEDQYLRWFTSDNKASYATKGMFGHTMRLVVSRTDKS